MRFKLSAHDLRVCTGRWQGQVREYRICTRCSLSQVEDEFHMVFECPAYSSLREQFGQLFTHFGGWDRCREMVRPDGQHLSEFIHQKPRVVAAFVHACWLQRCSPTVAQVMPDIEAALEASEDLVSILSDELFYCEESLLIDDDPMSDSLAPTGCPDGGHRM